MIPDLNSSDEGSQHMVPVRNKKNYHQILLLIYLLVIIALNYDSRTQDGDGGLWMLVILG